jgi:DNA primase
MLTTLSEQDIELDYIDITKKDIINSITLEDVKTFLESLGVDQIAMYKEKDYLICPTICHNPLHEAESMKLYWYQNNKIFRCYTECNEAMSIFTLYKKFISVNENRDITDDEAENYVKHCLKQITHIKERKNREEELDREKYKYTKNIPILDEYPETMLSYFTKYYHPLWLKDGITKESMDRFQISFSIGQNKIIIPHFDINGRLVGIRARSIEPEDIKLGKYRPIQVGSTIYTHQLQFNLYGIYEHQIGIQHRRSAIIVEGEKSVLLDDGYYGDLSNAVACCGSTFNKYYISLLTNILGANEIIIALDKEYEDCRDEKAKKYKEKLVFLCKKYKNQASFSYIWDFDNVLKEKDSPYDRGKDIFEHLYKTRVKVK